MSGNSFRPAVEPLEPREVPAIIFGLTASNRLITFDSANPGVVLGGFALTGLLNAAGGEVMTSIDVRPGSGGLYGRSSTGQLYLINPFSGFSLAVGTPVPNNSVFSGFDFDPTADRIRVAGNNTSNLLISPTFGTLIAAQANLQYRAGDVAQGLAPRVTGLGYTNSFPFAAQTVLFGIDHVRNTLVQIGNRPDNAGLTRTIGPLGFDVTGRVGFDINPVTGQAVAVLQRPGQAFSGFYSINLTTGRAGLIGLIGPGRLLTDVAVDLRNAGNTFFAPPVTSPTTFAVNSPIGTVGGTGTAGGFFSPTGTGFVF
jgi:hypothetical protein